MIMKDDENPRSAFGREQGCTNASNAQGFDGYLKRAWENEKRLCSAVRRWLRSVL